MVNLKRKKVVSVIPLRFALKRLIFELKDSAVVMVFRVLNKLIIFSRL